MNHVDFTPTIPCDAQIVTQNPVKTLVRMREPSKRIRGHSFFAAALIALFLVTPELDAQRRSRRRRWTPPPERVLKTVEFRAMAYQGDSYGKASFDLKNEARRLSDWINTHNNRERLLRDPTKVEQFCWLRRDEGGPLSLWLRWYPRVISESKRRPGKFDFALSNVHGKVIAVPLFDQDEYQRGPQTMTPRLIEFVPISTFAPYFDQNDIDPQSLTIIPPRTTGDTLFRVRYTFNPARTEDLARWNEKHLLHVAPVINDGRIVRADVIRAAKPAQGVLHAGNSLSAAQDFVKQLRVTIKSDNHPGVSLALRREPAAASNIKIYADQIRNHADATVRLISGRRLAWYGRDAGEAIGALSSAVRDQDARVAIAAIDALGAMGSDAMAAVPTLSRLRYASHVEVQAHARSALQKIRFNGKKSRR